MKIEHHALLDVLCGEYLLGTLRGAARRFADSGSCSSR